MKNDLVGNLVMSVTFIAGAILWKVIETSQNAKEEQKDIATEAYLRGVEDGKKMQFEKDKDILEKHIFYKSAKNAVIDFDFIKRASN